jgi:succinate-semialdehyde dehydrogenase/glutarate-semialdehyde dehydrogenase
MAHMYKQLIGGEWCGASGGGIRAVVNPATEEAIRDVPYGSAADCRAAIDAAARAFAGWSGRTPYERGSILKRAGDLIRAKADDLARTTVLESGKPFVQARGEWMVSADLFEWFAEEGKRAYGRIVPSRVGSRRLSVHKHPIGVVGIITAWNFPAYNVARAAAAALAAGCTIVIRPSEYTPLTAMDMANACSSKPACRRRRGEPVNGEADPIGQGNAAPPGVREDPPHGQLGVGKHLMDGASKTMTRLSLGAWRQRAGARLPDVDLAQIAAGAVAELRNGGQVCIAPAVSRRAPCRRRVRGARDDDGWRAEDGIRPRRGRAGRSAHQRAAARWG